MNGCISHAKVQLGRLLAYMAWWEYSRLCDELGAYYDMLQIKHTSICT